MKILIADDHTLFREGLAFALNRLNHPEPTVLQAQDGHGALQLASHHHDLDLILLDLDLPDKSGLELLAHLKKNHPQTPKVVISAHEDHQHIIQSLNMGAKGFIVKTSSTEVTLSALKLILSGGIYLPPQLMPYQSDKIYEQPPTILTPRQMEILHLLRQGIQNKGIAFQLNLSISTVKTHVRRIFTTLDAKNRTEAVSHAINRGIIKP